MPRIAIVEKDKCHPQQCGNYLCIRLCPINRAGDECIVKGDDSKARIMPELCTGCGICPKKCPFGAIHIINLPEELDNTPIHRYGLNGFHLYNLPTPLFGKVVGVLGRNGIGKSTAIKILAGALVPNLGSEERQGTYDEIIDYFKGQEAQLYFQTIKEGKINVAYKPQAVELIPKHSKGSVRSLLQKVDEKQQLSRVVKDLQLDKILDHDISTISGGELQRVALAATVLKKANVCFFDEPTSYLDIKQRIRAAAFIQQLATKDTAVIVIEHDLIILDYVTDLVHVMYGEQACYGITSLPKSTKNGINIYLGGYIKDENMRFRDHAIAFHAKLPSDIQGQGTLVSWQGIKKQLGSFSLSAPKGEIRNGEVVGMLGENGIGKTSFVKMLAGVLEWDEGSISTKLKVSYKPQYIASESEAAVMTVLDAALQKYSNQLIKPLELGHILEKRICDLSGGELQRVAISECLARDADLYLLDEPSAYLDVEQRLAVSKVIRDMMSLRAASAMIVDHDLLFIDYISDRICVVDGDPAVQGEVRGIYSMEEGMNLFLEGLGITFRRDTESSRPRANKVGSQLDQKQKVEGKLYYG
ncbi:ribosome biogenesis/translation initiation ATPase RLI [Candidatus Woesearchaeota archaeon]|nr:ribosome biogenesis/translation initiation ATPase RLI [Candidatus Woesearchaeota archaeon]